MLKQVDLTIIKTPLPHKTSILKYLQIIFKRINIKVFEAHQESKKFIVSNYTGEKRKMEQSWRE